MEFKKKSLIDELKMNKEEMELYYKQKREYIYNTTNRLPFMKLRKQFSVFLRALISLERKFIYRNSLKVINDKRYKTKKPIIYACTHVGIRDIEVAFEAFNDHAYLFMADPETMYRTFEGALLHLNGVIYMDGYDSSDRQVAKDTAERLLNQGGNLLLYPEGAWNVTENEAVMKLYTGAVDLALATGADIVPIAVEQYGKSFYVNIGENISYDKFGSYDSKYKANIAKNYLNNDFEYSENCEKVINKAFAKKLTDDLRDTLATLKWEIWDLNPANRDDFFEGYSEYYLKTILDECGEFYNMQKIIDARFRDKNVTDKEDVFVNNLNVDNTELKLMLNKND